MEKKYEEALERARMSYNADVTQGTKNVLETIFPELKESEDERIRKAIIDIVKSQKEQQCHIDGAIYDKMIAWLEKQGEQEEPQVYETEGGEVITYSESEGYKVVEPKFHEGDWSEEDKIHYNKCLQYLESISPRKEDIEWFKSLTPKIEEKSADKVKSKFKVDN